MASAVRQIVRAVTIAPLPKAPSIIEGVINVRGAIVPVLDIRQRFGLPPSPVAPSHHLVLAQTARREVAIRVDQATGLVSVPDEEIRPAAETAPGAQLVAGIARLPDGVLVIHDLDRFLSLEEEEETATALAGMGG